ncbi:MAG: hypothetical protein KGZ69_13545 [Methylomonas sp.]|nr:hypothetical protein [Methylomonas sp.]
MKRPAFAPDELQRLGRALFGNQWQTPLARALGRSDRTVRRWRSGTRSPSAADWRLIQEWFVAHRVVEVLDLINDLAKKTGETPAEIIFTEPETPLEKIIVRRVQKELTLQH